MSAFASSLMEAEISGVVVWGKIIRELFFNAEVMESLEASGIPKRKLEILKRTDSQNTGPGELQLMSSCLTKYTDAYYNKKGRKPPVFSMVKGLVTSPDYKWKDVKAVLVNGYRGNHSLWEELLRIDLTDILARTGVPYRILQGDTDLVASTKKVKEVVEYADNPMLSWCEVRDTGHFPGADALEKVCVELSVLAG